MRVPEDPRTDAELLAAVAAGDPSAFDVLYRRHRDWVVRMAARLCGDEPSALDVLQETFLYVLRKAPGLQLHARFSTFLFPVVRNLALAQRRRRQAVQPVAEPPSAEPSADQAEDLVTALGGLPLEQREAVLLRFVDGLALEEIAVRMGVPLGTVKSRLHQAMATLRQDPRARRYFLS